MQIQASPSSSNYAQARKQIKQRLSTPQAAGLFSLSAFMWSQELPRKHFYISRLLENNLSATLSLPNLMPSWSLLARIKACQPFQGAGTSQDTPAGHSRPRGAEPPSASSCRRRERSTPRKTGTCKQRPAARGATGRAGGPASTSPSKGERGRA